ncbi:hypothetical protein F441_18087 [Phytophthora nicotianae CJ01A1]|uniref:Uncharacterized protein n=5 Tax=Phytophthora nicotianae TaxID=4792 RepID=V9E901_PHYNI|nr:hypothetical protein F443_18219 [Phytophthora nicotianae P1569]ETL82352.1 hypothetical protein L917_17476 [Phytophthora nicotianae]ETO64149.1 hypothetical protein F444_18243 [Phytophthora nicotianae P1976]ETP05282.1 hypothetical protein F441_18087 [Phytophthora nicotianae CJ01A1]ETP33408.1 hypothetical protein F442_18062 [Phytophthora nicotianae P10297]
MAILEWAREEERHKHGQQERHVRSQKEAVAARPQPAESRTVVF